MHAKSLLDSHESHARLVPYGALLAERLGAKGPYTRSTNTRRPTAARW